MLHGNTIMGKMPYCVIIYSFVLSYLLQSYGYYRSKWQVNHGSALFSSFTPIIPDLKDVKYKMRDIIPTDNIQSIRLRHIQVETKEMATECKSLLSSGTVSFTSLAETMSTCEATKSKGGDLGWYHFKESSHGNDSVIFMELVNAAISMSKGDIAIVSSTRVGSNQQVFSWHVLQVMDIITTLSPILLRRKKDSIHNAVSSDSFSHNQYYSIDTMGCQMNLADSERIEAQLVDLGYSKVPDGEEPNLVVINTCSIRDHAEQKVYSYIGPHAARRRNGDKVSIIVTGCVAQQEGEELIKRFPEVDAVMGPQYTNRMTELLQSIYDGNQVVATDPAYQQEDELPAIRRSEITAYVNVIYGCNERCTYCVVPNTRGVEQSRTKEAIAAEVAELVQHGYKEVTLLGQNIDSWGR